MVRKGTREQPAPHRNASASQRTITSAHQHINTTNNQKQPQQQPPTPPQQSSTIDNKCAATTRTTRSATVASVTTAATGNTKQQQQQLFHQAASQNFLPLDVRACAENFHQKQQQQLKQKYRQVGTPVAASGDSDFLVQNSKTRARHTKTAVVHQ